MASGAPGPGSAAPAAPAKAGASPASSSGAPPAAAPSSDATKETPQPSQHREVRPIPDPDKQSAVERRRAAKAGEKSGATAKPSQAGTPEPKTAKAPAPAPAAGEAPRDPKTGQFVPQNQSAEVLRGDKSALEARREAKAQAARTPEQVAAEAQAALAQDSGKKPEAPSSSDPGQIPDGPMADGRFALGNKIYPNAQAAGQAHRSLQGIHKSMETTTAKAAELARGWETAHTRDVATLRNHIATLQAEITKLKGGAPSAPQSPTSGDQPAAAPQPTPAGSASKPFHESMDWKTFNDLYRSPEFGPAGAQIYLAQQLDAYNQTMRDSLKAEIMASLKGELEPLRKTHEMVDKRVQSQAALHSARALWSQVAVAKNPETGEPFYPELAADPKLVEEIIPIWLSYGPEFGFTDRGVFNAYLEWKHWRGAQASVASDAGQTAASVIAQLDGQSNSGARAVVGGASVHGVSPTPPAPMDPRAQRGKAVMDGIRAAAGSHRTSTGFDLGRTNR